MKINNFFKPLTLYLLILFFLPSPGISKESSLFGEITKIDKKNSVFTLKTMDGKQKEIHIGKSTLLYRKTSPRQQNFASQFSDFKTGDSLLVIGDDTGSYHIHPSRVWEQRAFLIQNNLIQTEKFMTGEIKSINKSKKIMVFYTFKSEKKNILLSDHTQITLKNLQGNLSNLKAGMKLAVYVRWTGFEEDEPDILKAHQILDTSAYVIQKYREKCGPILAEGKVEEVNMESASIKVGTPSGMSYTVFFNSSTRWIPGNPKIKKPTDFIGHEIYVFGHPSREGKNNAVMVMNQLGINTLFELIVKGGDVPGTQTILALGELVGIDAGRISVMYGGKKVVAHIIPQTLFFKKDTQVTYKDIQPGEQVLVKGIYDKEPVALTVQSFGKKEKK